MSNDTQRKFDGPPLNTTPPDGEHTFKVCRIKETAVKKTSKGVPIVKVGLIDPKTGYFVTAAFFGTPKALPRAKSLVEATGQRAESVAGIQDEFQLATYLQAAEGKYVKATIKQTGSREWNGRTYTDYDVGNFQPPL